VSELEDKKINRRSFLARGTKAALSVAAAGIIAKTLYDKTGPSGEPETELVTLPDFSVVPKDGQRISIVKGGDRIQTVDKAIDLLGGIERFIKAGDVVVIKPNVAFTTAPALGATTNPDLVAEVVRLCYSRGQAKTVYVTDNPINDAESCFALSGVGKAAAQAGAKIILPKDRFFKKTTLASGKLIRKWPILYEPLAKANKVIGIAPIKNHSRAGASMTMKNWYGLLGGRRNRFHQDINTIIAELSMLVKPTLVIGDGTEVMMTNGPTGGSISDLRRKDTMIVSCDQVAADAFGCELLDMKVDDLPYLSMAEQAGVGKTDYQSLKPIIAT
jgi:uncharacterized protein (DUF362 family)